MTGLLSLPNELLAQIFGSFTTARNLLRLASTNRRLHDVWLTHAEQIIMEIHEHSVPHFRDAVDLTLTENHLEAPSSSDGNRARNLKGGPGHLGLHSLLPLILRNVDLATQVCDLLEEHLQSHPPEFWRRQQAKTSLHAAYYVARRAALAHFRPDIRPGLMDTLRGMSHDAANTNLQVWFSIDALAPPILQTAHGYVLAEEEEEDDIGNDRIPKCWRFARRLLRIAVREKEPGTSGRLEDTWTNPFYDVSDGWLKIVSLED